MPRRLPRRHRRGPDRARTPAPCPTAGRGLCRALASKGLAGAGSLFDSDGDVGKAPRAVAVDRVRRLLVPRARKVVTVGVVPRFVDDEMDYRHNILLAHIIEDHLVDRVSLSIARGALLGGTDDRDYTDCDVRQGRRA